MNFPLRPTKLELAGAYVAIFSVAFLFVMGVIATARLAFETVDGAVCAPEYVIVGAE